jgi:hypothetical protein
MNPSPAPNNLGATLLLAVGLLSSPLVVGVPLVIVALAAVRTAAGDPALPRLTRWLQGLRRGQILPAALPRFASLQSQQLASKAAEVTPGSTLRLQSNAMGLSPCCRER